MSIETVRISLYQSLSSEIRDETPTNDDKESTSRMRRSPLLCGPLLGDERGNYRGDVLVPFYKDCTTYGELAAGVTFRLNQYFVIHPSNSRQRSATDALHSRAAVCHRAGNNCRNCGCCFKGDYFCDWCSSGESVAAPVPAEASSDSHRQDMMGQCPEIVVHKFTRMHPFESNESGGDYEVVRDDCKVEQGHICCFFSLIYTKGNDIPQSIRTRDGYVIRPHVGRDHLNESRKESALGREGEGQEEPSYIEVKVGERLMRIAHTDGLQFEGVVDRLRRRNLHVQRLFDGMTGASILPCELVKHFAGRLKSFCASVVPQDPEISLVRGSSLGLKRLREYSGDVDVRTIISVSEERFHVGSGRNILISVSPCGDSNFTYNDANSGGLWTAQQLRHQTFFDISSDSNVKRAVSVAFDDPLSPSNSMELEGEGGDVAGTPGIGDGAVGTSHVSEIILTQMKEAPSGTHNVSNDIDLTLGNLLEVDERTSTSFHTSGSTETYVEEGCGAYVPTDELNFLTSSLVTVTQHTFPDNYFEESDEDEDNNIDANCWSENLRTT